MKPIEKTIETVFERKNSYESHKKIQRATAIKIASIVSCLCLLFGVFVGSGAMLTKTFAAEDYRILLDINPSIEISVDKNNTVKEFDGSNEDGDKILEGMNLKGESTPDALKNVISEMVDKGYISEEANSVLVSIEGADQDKSDAIKEEIANSITETLNEKSIEGAIIIQSISPDDESLNSESEAYGISAGKVQLINQILEQNKLLTFEELAQMSIHELNLLRISYYVDMENAYESGTPVEFAYIGAQNAKDIAQTDAQVNVDSFEAKLECHSSKMIYCVEFDTETNKYRYIINAVTGEILSAEKIDFTKDNFFEGDKEIAIVGENAAILAALSNAGMEDSTLIRCKYNRDWVDGTVVYNIFFTNGIKSGRYVVNARTGEILKHSITQEYHDRSVKSTVIGDFEAKRIALAKDGLIDGNVSKYEMNLRLDGETYVYDLNYICNAAKYIVQINAESGTIISFEKIVLKDTGSSSVEDGTHSSVEG